MRRIAVSYTPLLTRIMALSTVIIAVSVFLYGIFLLEAVGNTAARAKAEREVRTLSSKVGALEEIYLQKTREITLDRAKEMGFVNPQAVSTIFAGAPLQSLSRSQ